MSLCNNYARIVIAGVASGVGKTTIATGLMAALVAQGLRVQGYKVGPDYIDPMYHRAATGRVSYNLDSWLTSPTLVRQRFEAGMGNADIAIIEGVMGLFDGRKQTLGTASTAEIAKLLVAPVLLVLDVAHMGQSAAAIVHGFQHLDPHLNIAGIILNRIASANHEATVRLAIAEWTGIPVLGVLRRESLLTLPSRHLGLIPVAETSLEVQALGDIIKRSVDLDSIVRVARAADVLPPYPSDANKEETIVTLSSRNIPFARIGLALDNAFSFYYPETLEAFAKMDVEVVSFSPLADSELPNDLDLLYFGGGFPEVFAAQLADNHPMLASVRAAAQRGMLIYAECGGYMYLGKQYIDANHVSHDLVSLLPYTFQMGTERAQLGYREITIVRDTLIGRAGTRLRGHEFHWSHIVEPLLEQYAPYQIEESRKAREGYASESILASYIHIPLAANPLAMRELLQRCRTRDGAQGSKG